MDLGYVVEHCFETTPTIAGHDKPIHHFQQTQPHMLRQSFHDPVDG